MTISRAMEMAGAREDFRRARAHAIWERITSRLRRESAELLSYDEVREQLRADASSYRGLQDIPLDAIVGSVGRYTDFTRSFLPRRADDETRWVRVEAAMLSSEGVPPIDVYQIGDVYFVLDGNHRVSVARQLGATHIQAYVREFHTDVPLTPDVQPDDLIVKAEYVEFLERTGLKDLRPDAELSVSVPGQHPVLEEHISVHRYFMGIDEHRPILYREAVAHWYDTVYLPVVRAIRDQNLLQEFPDRTEADLYLWLAEHRAALERELAWQVRPEVAARDLAARSSRDRTRALASLSQRVVEPFLGRAPGQWREEQLALRQSSLFTDVLASVSGRKSGWVAFEWAVEVLRHEEGRLLGVHVVPSENDQDSAAVRALESEFAHRCREAGVQGAFVVGVGDIAPTICRRARWTSLVVIGLAHPPGDRPIDRLSSGLRWLIQNCPGPVLAAPELSAPQGRVAADSALVAYDGSPKADEALYLATYLANQWGTALTVLTVDDKRGPTGSERSAPVPRATAGGQQSSDSRDGIGAGPRPLLRAQEYLEGHGVDARYEVRHGSVAEAILAVAVESSCALIMMGGYGFSQPLQIVLGSAVDQVLRESMLPVLICR